MIQPPVAGKLDAVKATMLITGASHDAALQALIDEVCQFLSSAGLDDGQILSDAANGLIARGVMDLFDMGSGEGRLSTYFMQRAIQMRSEAARSRSEAMGGG